MTVEAFVFVRAAPGKATELITKLAEAKTKQNKKYMIEGMKRVYKTSGHFDAIAHISADDVDELFHVVDEIKSLHGSGPITSGTSVTIAVPKHMGDP